MKIKDIVNRDLVNLTNCEQEPIHIPGSIQPHGFLVAMHIDSMIIDYCSANVYEFTGITHEQCLGKKFNEIFGADAERLFKEYLSKPLSAVNPPLELEVYGKAVLCTPYSVDHYYVAEFEPTDPDSPDVSAIYNQTIQFVSYMERSETLRELCAKVADQTRTITGYDRVMIYRFDKDYNGEVFAESKVDDIEPFLGLHYPHTDIPAQARQLYLTNLMRIIVDTHYTPVPIYTIDDATGKNLDLSRSYLRSVSPIHIQYLHNMGVGGTLTISLIHQGRLWGLITCHHYSAKYVSLYSRIAAQMQGYFLTSQINVRQLNEEYKKSAEINAALETLLEVKVEPETPSFEQIVQHPQLAALCDAGGVAILFEGKLYTQGNTPANDDIAELATWLNAHARKGEYNTSRLADVYPAAKSYADSGAGIIYQSLSTQTIDCIIWFAPETQQEVNWAGDPGNAILKTEKGLTPRNSFALWKEILKYQSKEWTTAELLATATFAHALQKHITLMLVSEEEKKQRTLTQQLQEANAELENINWISSHDFKEPLRKIQLFSSRILDKDSGHISEYIAQSLQKVHKSANRMQQLLADITAYNKVRKLPSVFEDTDLNKILHEVVEEMRDDITEKHAILNYTGLPVINGVPFLLRQLFLNLLRNSMKFAKSSEAPQIEITCADSPVWLPGIDDRQFYKIELKDNGIGFPNTHNESIFKVFTKLHGVAEYEGSGIGLALCRKIMQNHKGYITADGRPGEGATFTMFFPAIAAAK